MRKTGQEPPVLDQIRRRKWNRLGQTLSKMTASPSRCYSGHHKATEEEGDQGIKGSDKGTVYM